MFFRDFTNLLIVTFIIWKQVLVNMRHFGKGKFQLLGEKYPDSVQIVLPIKFNWQNWKCHQPNEVEPPFFSLKDNNSNETARETFGCKSKQHSTQITKMQCFEKDLLDMTPPSRNMYGK